MEQVFEALADDSRQHVSGDVSGDVSCVEFKAWLRGRGGGVAPGQALDEDAD